MPEQYHPCTKQKETTHPEPYRPCISKDEALEIITTKAHSITRAQLIRLLEFAYYMTPMSLTKEDFIVAAHEALDAWD